MTVPVQLQDLRAELDRRDRSAYLLTVGDDGRPHCVATSLAWDDDDLVARAGRTSAHNAGARRGVTVVVPPLPPAPTVQPPPPPDGPASPRDGEPASSQGALLGGYTLIIDADADVPSTAAQDGMVRLRATHAVLHRPASGPEGGRVHDCAHVLGADSPA